MSTSAAEQELYKKGFDLRCEGRYAEARAVLTEVLRQNPSHSDARWQLGLIQGFEGDFDGSLETLKSVVAMHPTHQSARFDLAMTYMMLGMTEEACAQLRELLRQNPNHERALQQIMYCP